MRTLRVQDLVVEYVSDGYTVRAIDGLSFEAGEGEIVLLLGPSGSGKTSLLSALAGILTPTSGRIEFGGFVLSSATPADVARYRRSQVGIVFQAFNLIPSLTALENVAAPLLVAGVPWRTARTRAADLLTAVNMSHRAGRRPGKLSGGQQQRVAVARALAHNPPLLLADEPTANLDYLNAEAIIELFRGLRSEGRTIIVSTHDDRMMPLADKVVQMLPEVDAAAAAPHRLEYATGETIFEQGSRGQLVYSIEEGQVEIVRVRADGTEHRVALLGPGQYFGELGPLLGAPRSATARAASRVALVAYGIREFRALAPEIGANVPAARDAAAAKPRRSKAGTR